jgi:hypothetical protein
VPLLPCCCPHSGGLEATDASSSAESRARVHTWPFRSNAITSVNSSWVANSNGDAVRAARGEVTGEAPKAQTPGEAQRGEAQGAV